MSKIICKCNKELVDEDGFSDSEGWLVDSCDGDICIDEIDCDYGNKKTLECKKCSRIYIKHGAKEPYTVYVEENQKAFIDGG